MNPFRTAIILTQIQMKDIKIYSSCFAVIRNLECHYKLRGSWDSWFTVSNIIGAIPSKYLDMLRLHHDNVFFFSIAYQFQFNFRSNAMSLQLGNLSLATRSRVTRVRKKQWKPHDSEGIVWGHVLLLLYSWWCWLHPPRPPLSTLCLLSSTLLSRRSPTSLVSYSSENNSESFLWINQQFLFCLHSFFVRKWNSPGDPLQLKLLWYNLLHLSSFHINFCL